MSIDIKLGARPWEPTPDSRLVLELDRYNVPLAGIVEQGGVRHLFVCAAGEEDQTNVWLYASINGAEEAALSSAEGDEVVRQIMLALRNKRVDCALAYDYDVIRTGWVDAGSEDPGISVRRFLGDVERQIEREQRGIRTIEHDLDTDDRRHTLASA